MTEDTAQAAECLSRLTAELDTISEEWNKGYSDCHSGLTRDDNPYAFAKYTMQQESDWDAGWLCAFVEKAGGESFCAFTGKPINDVLADIGREVAMGIFVCESIGHVTGGMQVTKQVDGTWLASCPIGNLFGEEVDGEHTATGETKEAAVLALEKEIKDFDEFMWM